MDLNGPAMTWFKKSLIALILIGVFLLLGRPPTISWAQGCDPANGVWVGCEIALAGTDVIIFKIGD